MKLKTLLMVYSLTAAGFCLGLVAIPGFWISLYGGHVDSQAMGLLRLVGALFGGVAIMMWQGRTLEGIASQLALVNGIVGLNALAALVATWIDLSGVYNQFAWGPVMT